QERERDPGGGHYRRPAVAQRAAVTGVDPAGGDLRRLRRHVVAAAVAAAAPVTLLRAGAVLDRAEVPADDGDGGRVRQVAAVRAGGGPDAVARLLHGQRVLGVAVAGDGDLGRAGDLERHLLAGGDAAGGQLHLVVAEPELRLAGGRRRVRVVLGLGDGERKRHRHLLVVGVVAGDPVVVGLARLQLPAVEGLDRAAGPRV